jgi:hypothetical protein
MHYNTQHAVRWQYAGKASHLRDMLQIDQKISCKYKQKTAD